ncbi:MAG: secretin N-terminal domain-containing protein [Planctomycetota bacterium]
MNRPLLRLASLCLALSLVAPGASAQDARIELLELRDLPLKDALQIVSFQTGLNVVASADAADRAVNLVLRDVDVLDALEALCQTHDLWIRADPETGIYRIATSAEYQRDIQSFRAAEVEVFTLLYPNARDVAQAIRDLFGQRVRLGQAGLLDQSIQDLQNRFQRFDLIDGRSQGFGQLGGTNQGGGFQQNRQQNQFGLGNRAGNNQNVASLLRAQTQQNQGQADEVDAGRERVEGLSGTQIQELEQGEADQVLGQLARQTSIYVSVNARTNQLFVRSGDPEALRQIQGLVQSMDRPTPLVLLEVKVLSILLDDDFNSVFDLQFNDPGSRTGGQFTTGAVAQQPADLVPTSDTLARRAADFGLAGTGVSPDSWCSEMRGQKCLRAHAAPPGREPDPTTLATPMLLTANNEVSRLFAGRSARSAARSGRADRGRRGRQRGEPGTTQVEFRPWAPRS